MKRYNIIAVVNKQKNLHLMCKRSKEPYKGLLNFVGGKIEEDEDSLDSAYRELYEETAISDKDISLTHILDLNYYEYGFSLEIFFGLLENDVCLQEEVNELVWLELDQNYADSSVFAGEGNMDFIMTYVKSKIYNL